MNTWLTRPNSEGWWFCFPASDSEWYDMYKNGLVVLVTENEWPRDADPEGGCSAQLGLNGDFVGFSGQYAGDIKGRWFGPLDLPRPPAVLT